MRSQELDLGSYDTDKIAHEYLAYYDPVFAPWVDEEITLLEVGIERGGSLTLWRDYFPKASVVGVDLKKLPSDFQAGERVHAYQGSQADLELLSRVAKERAPNGFDIIIDDASHLGELTKLTFWHLFDNHLKPNGIYAIEDWPTGYWESWPDGRALDLDKISASPKVPTGRLWSRIARRFRRRRPMACHSYGLVGFVKQLIDEQAASDVLRASPSDPPGRPSKFESMLIYPSIVFLRKAPN